jgi:hypothetical protein
MMRTDEAAGMGGHIHKDVSRGGWHRTTQFCIETVKRAAWRGTRWFWLLHSHWGGTVRSKCARKLTVIISTYSPARMRNIPALVRSLLKCGFVERIIVSNNNPAVRIGERLSIRDPRLVLLDQSVRRGPGYSWVLALREQAEYFMSIDDDMLVFPRQVALLFERLVERPDVPHGFAGQRGSQYVQCRESEVDTLYLIYAATKVHAQRYVEIITSIGESGILPVEVAELWGDDIILSRTGSGKPLIHDAGFLLQADTCYDPRIAIHKQAEFQVHRKLIESALKNRSA